MARRWLVRALAATGVAATAGLVYVALRRPAPAALGELDVTPQAAVLSVRVGETLDFAASAANARAIIWSVWGRPVAEEHEWSYVPRRSDAGWQQVKVVALGRDGTRRERTWDVGVVANAPPELVDLVPQAGRVPLEAGERATFRCSARVPAARSADRLTFEWVLDGRLIHRDQRPATGAMSEVVLPAPGAGPHRVAVQVMEDARTASFAEWQLEVAAPTPPPAPAPTPTEPPVVLVPPSPPVVASPPQFVPASGRRRLALDVGERLALAVGVTPPEAEASYVWTVDGRPVQRGGTSRLIYEAATPGEHRVAVTASVDGQKLGSDGWTVTVRAPEAAEVVPAPRPPLPEAPQTARGDATPPPPAVRALGEAEVLSWLQDYARAWSRKDVDALRRMGQVRSAKDAEQLENYFRSIDELHVDVRMLGLRIDGERASVEFERTDTVTDPAGQRRTLRLPPFRKRIERTPQGLRFAGDGQG